MEDKELDQMLKKALIPNIKDNETKIRFEMEIQSRTFARYGKNKNTRCYYK